MKIKSFTRLNSLYYLLIFPILIFFGILINNHNNNNNDLLKKPWHTVRINKLLVQVPVELIEEKNVYKKEYENVIDSLALYSYDNENLYIQILYSKIKPEKFNSWNLEKSSSAILNQILYNLGADEINITKSVYKELNTIHVSKATFTYNNDSSVAFTYGIKDDNVIYNLTLINKRGIAEQEKILDRIFDSIKVI